MNKKVVVITGASSGLGKELAKIYSNNNYSLVLCGRNEQGFEEFKKNDAEIIIGDLTQNSTLNEIADIVQNKKKKIDILINNAGIVYIQPFENNTDEQLDRIFEINVKSHIKLTQKLYPLMKKQHSGHIINIISAAGMEPKINHTMYCATKFAIRGFTDALRLEAKESNIKVTGIYPGGIKTHIFDKLSQKIDQSTFMDPRDVAEAIYNLSQVTNVSPDSLILSRMSSVSSVSLYRKGHE